MDVGQSRPNWKRGYRTLYSTRLCEGDIAPTFPLDGSVQTPLKATQLQRTVHQCTVQHFPALQFMAVYGVAIVLICPVETSGLWLCPLWTGEGKYPAILILYGWLIETTIEWFWCSVCIGMVKKIDGLNKKLTFPYHYECVVGENKTFSVMAKGKIRNSPTWLCSGLTTSGNHCVTYRHVCTSFIAFSMPLGKVDVISFWYIVSFMHTLSYPFLQTFYVKSKSYEWF